MPAGAGSAPRHFWKTERSTEMLLTTALASIPQAAFAQLDIPTIAQAVGEGKLPIRSARAKLTELRCQGSQRLADSAARQCADEEDDSASISEHADGGVRPPDRVDRGRSVREREAQQPSPLTNDEAPKTPKRKKKDTPKHQMSSIKREPRSSRSPMAQSDGMPETGSDADVPSESQRSSKASKRRASPTTPKRKKKDTPKHQKPSKHRETRSSRSSEAQADGMHESGSNVDVSSGSQRSSKAPKPKKRRRASREESDVDEQSQQPVRKKQVSERRRLDSSVLDQAQAAAIVIHGSDSEFYPTPSKSTSHSHSRSTSVANSGYVAHREDPAPLRPDVNESRVPRSTNKKHKKRKKDQKEREVDASKTATAAGETSHKPSGKLHKVATLIRTRPWQAPFTRQISV